MAAPILSYEGLGLVQGSGWLFQDLDIYIGARDRLALIGRNGIEAFFGSPGAEAVGKSIQLRGKSYTVIGVLYLGLAFAFRGLFAGLYYWAFARR